MRDFLSGFFLLIEDHYGVGDVVDLGEASGTVEQVTLRVTRLRDQNGTVWHIPNGEIRRVGNKSQQWARAVLDVAVSPQADLERAAQVIGRAAEQVWELPEAKPDVLEHARGAGHRVPRPRRRHHPRAGQDPARRPVAGQPPAAGADRGGAGRGGHRPAAVHLRPPGPAAPSLTRWVAPLRPGGRSWGHGCRARLHHRRRRGPARAPGRRRAGRRLRRPRRITTTTATTITATTTTMRTAKPMTSWVLVPLVVGLVIGLAVALYFGLGSAVSEFG